MQRIGILGGSFNPVHNGHLLMAELAMAHMHLDHVIFMPAHCSPYKTGQNLADAKHRLNMVRLAIKGNPNLCLSDMEIKRGGVSYAIDTLRAVHEQNPKAKLFWIVGEDNVGGLEGWKDFDQIIGLASFVAISREWFNISSSLIRRNVRQKKSIRYLTPEAVIRYINKHHLYR